VVYDYAGVLTPETERTATEIISAIEDRDGVDMVVYTQEKRGSTFESTDQDAMDLMAEWGMSNGLVIMWNSTRAGCRTDRGGNGFVDLYADPSYSQEFLSTAERQDIFDNAMLPYLLECDEDSALLAALDRLDDAGSGTHATPRPTANPNASAACSDDTYTLDSSAWDGAYQWHFQESSVPPELDANDVLAVVRRSVSNITDAVNDCGLPDNVDAEAEYVGTTTNAPCVGDFADGQSVIGFGIVPSDLPPLTVAAECPYGPPTAVVEADILISLDINWSLSEGSCVGSQELLEATLTHEFGHVFGLGHVSERRHPDLTMSTASNGPCHAEEITLGLGDVLGLEELY